ncbi:MAG: NAD(P)(+) transhydrogenase (Re/Si-specific) subunit beta [Gaiellales bacterium]|nr:NAD(P)(+) transhydrogenase (Re/Si-specific) subunit beta [Gaiellales bacterium]
MNTAIQAVYLVAALLFILGLRRMSSPKSARTGIIWAGAGMAIAILITFLWPGMENYLLMIIAVVVGGGVSYVLGRRVAMTDMPQMVALFNGMGGGAAAAISAAELVRPELPSTDVLVLAVLGAIIGMVSFSGSLIAFAKLQGLIKRSVIFPGQNVINMLFLAAALVFGALLVAGVHTWWTVLGLFAASFLFGILMTLPIGGADMPVVISLYNALTGLAVGFEGYVLGNVAMIVAGTVVGSAGTLLTQLMAKAMNRSLGNVLFSGFGAQAGQAAAGAAGGAMKAIDVEDAAIQLAYAQRVVIVPGYGMAVAQAQHKVWGLTQYLQQQGVEVKFAIHPVAGRMPGHMNVLLAEAGVPYELIVDMEEINEDFANTDVAVVIGANDVVNPSARTDVSSPIYGMPILDVDKSHNVLVIKRGRGTGFAGVDNPLFVAENTRMLFGDAQAVVNDLVQVIKKM